MYIYDKNFERELWQANKKDWLNLQVARAKNWVVTNPELSSALALAVSYGSKVMFDSYRAHKRTTRINQELKAKERTFYDRSINAYYITRKVPTTKQKAIIAQRKRNGETYDVILKSLGLL
jgi:hypothetical protein